MPPFRGWRSPTICEWEREDAGHNRLQCLWCFVNAVNSRNNSWLAACRAEFCAQCAKELPIENKKHDVFSVYISLNGAFRRDRIEPHPTHPTTMLNKKKLFQLAKGFRGRARNCVRIARPKVEKALQYATRDRKTKKREFRQLWVTRINAAAREHGVCLEMWKGGCMHACVVMWHRWMPHCMLITYHHSGQLKYSVFLAGLTEQNIKLDRKVLSEIAIYEPHSFKALVDQVKFMKGLV